MKKQVAFDIGNVLAHVDIDSFYDFLIEKEIVKDKTDAYNFLYGVQHAQDLGFYNIRQGLYRFYPELPRYKLQEVHDKWLNIAQPSLPMLDLLDRLINNQGFEVALLSNIGFDHAGVIRNKCPIFQKCNQYFSCEIGTAKPSKLYFINFIKQTGWGNNVPFFDDRLENIKAAEGLLSGNHFDLENFPDDNQAACHIRNILADIYS